MIVERGAKWNALLFQDASNGRVTDAELCGDAVGTLPLAIELDNSGSQRWRSNGFRSGFFGEQPGDSELAKLASPAGEVSQVEVKGLGGLVDFGDAGLDQLDGAKAMQDLIVKGITIEGRLIDEDRANAIEIAKPSSSIDRNGALGQCQVVYEL